MLDILLFALIIILLVSTVGFFSDDLSGVRALENSVWIYTGILLIAIIIWVVYSFFVPYRYVESEHVVKYVNNCAVIFDGNDIVKLNEKFDHNLFEEDIVIKRDYQTGWYCGIYRSIKFNPSYRIKDESISVTTTE